MRILLIVAAVAITMAACAGIPQTPAEIEAAAQAQITASCPVAQAEIATLQSLSASLTADVNDAVADASPVVATMCAPGFQASSASLVTFLPAVTVIAVQYSATHK